MDRTQQGFDAATEADVESVLDHLNANHADTVLLVARHLGGTEIVDAELRAAGPDRAEFAVSSSTGSGPATITLDFDPVAAGVDEVQLRLLAALSAARAAAPPDLPLTSLESEMAVTATLRTVDAEVRHVSRLSPDLLEVTLGGLDDYPLQGGDEFVYVMVSHEPGGVRRGYSMADYRDERTDGAVRGAYYTIRRARRTVGEIDLWVVVHDHPGTVAAWMATAQPGAGVALWGPRTGFRPADSTRYLLAVADESGIAAVAAIVERLDRAVRTTAVLETAGDAHPPLPDHPGLDVHWVHRGDEPPGRTNHLLAAVNRLVRAAPDAAFGAAESRQISAVRRHLRTTLGMPSSSMLMTGYWRRGVH